MSRIKVHTYKEMATSLHRSLRLVTRITPYASAVTSTMPLDGKHVCRFIRFAITERNQPWLIHCNSLPGSVRVSGSTT